MVSTRTSITTVLFNLPVFRVYTGWTGTLSVFCEENAVNFVGLTLCFEDSRLDTL